MNNEIGRKLTSLTLMTIMLAGGMTIAAPSMMVPEAAAAGALYVSAENAMFNNTFGGVQIVEVVVIGHADETDENKENQPLKFMKNNLEWHKPLTVTGTVTLVTTLKLVQSTLQVIQSASTLVTMQFPGCRLKVTSL